MQQKDGSGMNKTPKRPSPITAFLAGIIRSSKMNKMMNLGGQIGGAQVFTGAPGKGSGFKQNQRKERKRSRIRKMKPPAR